MNVPKAGQVAMVDRDAGRQVATWKLTGGGNPVKGIFEGQGNFPMALDEAHGRLLVVDRNPPELLVFDTASGEVVARRPTCGDADDVFFDAKRERVYVSCGEGFIDVVQRHDDAYEDLVAFRPSPAPAPRCSCRNWIDFTLRCGLEGKPAAVWAYRPSP